MYISFPGVFISEEGFCLSVFLFACLLVCLAFGVMRSALDCGNIFVSQPSPLYFVNPRCNSPYPFYLLFLSRSITPLPTSSTFTHFPLIPPSSPLPLPFPSPKYPLPLSLIPPRPALTPLPLLSIWKSCFLPPPLSYLHPSPLTHIHKPPSSCPADLRVYPPTYTQQREFLRLPRRFPSFPSSTSDARK